MPRLRQVKRDDIHPRLQRAYHMSFGERDASVQPGTASGTPGNWFTTLALMPDAFAEIMRLGNAVRRTPYLEAWYEELVVMRSTFLTQAQFNYSQHCKQARAARVSEDKIQAIPSWTTSTLFSQAERALLAYTDEVVLQHGRVQDRTFARLQEHFSDEAILNMTLLATLYHMLSAVARSLRLEYDDVPERVAEVPAPSSNGR